MVSGFLFRTNYNGLGPQSCMQFFWYVANVAPYIRRQPRFLYGLVHIIGMLAAVLLTGNMDPDPDLFARCMP